MVLKVTFSFVGKKGDMGGWVNGKAVFAKGGNVQINEQWWCSVVKETNNYIIVKPIAPVHTVVTRTIERCPVCAREEIYDCRREQRDPQDNGDLQVLQIVCLKCRELLPHLIYHFLYAYPLPRADIPKSALAFAEAQANQLARSPSFLTPQQIVAIATKLEFPPIPERIWERRTMRVTKYGDFVPSHAINPRLCVITDYEEQLYPSLNPEGEIKRLCWCWEEDEEDVVLVNRDEIKRALEEIQNWWEGLGEKERTAVYALAAHQCLICKHPLPALCVAFRFDKCSLAVFTPHEFSHTELQHAPALWNLETLVELAARTKEKLLAER